MDPTSPVPQKKGLGPLGWVGIGCGSLVVLLVAALAIGGMILGPKAKRLAEEMKENPTRAMATTMVSASFGQLEMVAQDDVNKRYTLKGKDGKLVTIYFSKRKGAPETISGDFSAIPTDDLAPAENSPAAK